MQPDPMKDLAALLVEGRWFPVMFSIYTEQGALPGAWSFRSWIPGPGRSMRLEGLMNNPDSKSRCFLV